MRRVIIGITVACILAVAVPLGGYLTARTVPTTACLDSGLRHGLDDSPVVATRIEQGSSARATAPAPAARRRLPTSLEAAGTTLAREQISNAAVIIAEGRAANLPPRGWVVALATALQESGLRALNHGDRDSQGIFQQRPSAGWGTPDQILNPSLSARAFYGVADHTTNPGLIDITGWPSMTIAEAAQAVQRSAFPDAYVRWEPAAKSIVEQFAGTVEYGSANRQPGAVACDPDTLTNRDRCPPTGLAAERGLTPDALLVVRCSKGHFPRIKTIYGVGHRANNPDSDHPSGRGVDLMVSDFPDYQPGVGSAYGWQIARWVRANHRALGVAYVIYAATIWSVAHDSEGWRPYRGLGGSGDTVMHYDHVHISVHGSRGTGLGNADGGGPGAARWVMPLPAGQYTVGCSVDCYAGHTGQDFRAVAGTDVYSSNAGTVVRSEALIENGRYISYGNLIVVRDATNPSIEIYYAHLSRRQVVVGETVTPGQVIALSGSTGNSEGPHLHFEIRVGGSPTDPMPFLQSAAGSS